MQNATLHIKNIHLQHGAQTWLAIWYYKSKGTQKTERLSSVSTLHKKVDMTDWRNWRCRKYALQCI